jgi:tryptophan synthase alpha subunit
VSNAAQAAAAAELADGVVVGSAAVLAAEDGAKALEAFVGQLRAALA